MHCLLYFYNFFSKKISKILSTFYLIGARDQDSFEKFKVFLILKTQGGWLSGVNYTKLEKNKIYPSP